MITEILKSKAVEGVSPRGAMATKKPSIITMAIDHRFAAEAYGYFEDRKDGKLPDTGLIGFKLMAIYEDGQREEVIELDFGHDDSGDDTILADGSGVSDEAEEQDMEDATDGK